MCRRLFDPKVPAGFGLLQRCFSSRWTPTASKRLFLHRVAILLSTFLTYTLYHASRKPLSVVKNELINCTDTSCKSWINELSNTDELSAQRIEGILDSTFLIAYSLAMFFSGMVAERVNLRLFLAGGMVLSGLFTALFGLGKVAGIHGIAYYGVIQLFSGIFQTTGWPSVVTLVANWFGHEKKGLLFGIWDSHSSIGNILGSVIAGHFVSTDWAYSFIVPGALLAAFGIVIWLFVIDKPQNIGIHPDGEEEVGSTTTGSPDVDDKGPPISFFAAFRIPGVVEFSTALFFVKLVGYTFLFWLPTFIKGAGVNITSTGAAFVSITFDVGAVLGGVLAGLIADTNGKSATTCVIMILLAIPVMMGYNQFGKICPINGDNIDGCLAGNLFLLLVTGLLVNGPNSLITTSVAAELGTHPTLKGSSRALSTVASLIEGTGSIGAAAGPSLASAIGIEWIFYMLVAADVMALLLLLRLSVKELKAVPEYQAAKQNYIKKKKRYFKK